MKTFVDKNRFYYGNVSEVINRSFICGFCGDRVSSNTGYPIMFEARNTQVGGLYICTNCQGVTTFTISKEQIPSPAFGKPVEKVPEKLNDLYEEVRRCTTQNCYSAAVLVSRIILMHIAVEKGANKGESFNKYVDYLCSEGYAPPGGKAWVDLIRTKGNEVNHEIEEIKKEDSETIIGFVEMLLKFIYEYPGKVPTEEGE